MSNTINEEDRNRIHKLACDIEYDMDNDTTTVQLYELGERITIYEREYARKELAELKAENELQKSELATMYDGFSKAVTAVKDQAATLKRYKDALEAMVDAITVMPRPPHPLYKAMSKAKSALSGTKETE